MYAQQQTMTANYILSSVPTLFPPSSFPSPLLHFLLGGQTHNCHELGAWEWKEIAIEQSANVEWI